ncbi:putative hemolysin [Komagataeibacter melomenusus]
MMKSSPIAGHTTWIRLAALGAVVVLGACAAPSGRAQAARIGMPNPASAYCVHLGGRLELRSSPQGTTGWCHLPDGTIIEEWALFRRNHSAGPR